MYKSVAYEKKKNNNNNNNNKKKRVKKNWEWKNKCVYVEILVIHLVFISYNLDECEK